MNKLLSKLISSKNCLNKLQIKVSQRGVTYEVLPSGEKVVVNVKTEVSTKREKWQNVRPMGREKELRDIKEMEMNERLESDPKVARNIASTKLQSFKDSLLERGFCRETKPYNPPPNVLNIIQNICAKVFENKSETENWKNISLIDPIIKYKFLTQCSKELNYEVPNSVLYLMKKVSDVYQFYSTPIRGISSYDQMVRNSDELPKNIHVIPEPIRYNPDHDEFFGGINAYPFSALRTRGLRAKKKYPSFKSPFQWPDI